MLRRPSRRLGPLPYRRVKMKKNRNCSRVISAVLVIGFVFVMAGCGSSPVSVQGTAPSPFEGFWTRIDLSESDDALAPEDWEFLSGGSLFILRVGTKNHSWKQDGTIIVVNTNDNFATYTLEIVNDNLLKGTAKNKNNLEWPVELRRIQNPTTLKNKSTGALTVLGVNGYFILDPATRLYQNLSEEQETEFMLGYMADGFLGTSSEADLNVYRDLIQYYKDDKAAWGFDVSQQKGSVYLVEFKRDEKSYYGVVAYLSFMDEMKYFVVHRDRQ
jgi:hypothetical protein